MPQERRKKTGHEKIQELRKLYDMPEEGMTPEEEDYERRYREARAKRVEEAGYVDRYVELFNRDFWTDKWLGPGPDPGYQYMEDTPKKTKVSDEEIEKKQWLDKYMPKNVPQMEIKPPKETKAIKKARKKRKQIEDRAARQKKYDLVYWWLEVYLKPEYARSIYHQYEGRLEEMVDWVYDYASNWLEYANRNMDRDHELTVEEVMETVEEKQQDREDVVTEVGDMKFKRLEVAERKRRHYVTDWRDDPCPEVPDEYWEEFNEWADDHPLKEFKKKSKKLGLGKLGAIGLRRIAFLKKINKRNKGFHKNIMKSGMNLFDPITGESFVSEKKMKDYMQKRMKRYDKQREEFVKLLDSMVKRGEISEDMAISWMDDTKEARERVKQRYKDMQDRIKKGQKRYGKSKFDPEHNKRYMKARDDWFKKFGGDPNGPPFTIEFDGEETEVRNIAKPGKPPIWRFDRPSSGKTDYMEQLD